ncbi:hypothetical protein FHS30_002814 [Simiduia aestuariiviva]|uniref:Uncharacterized protein n=1 Tax=Simiduia aestuariiviva TaxID=1510459 RepID=A0A839USC6_9GAMM|nr:hypothetical protein [Simiduia aestuariiviva]
MACQIWRFLFPMDESSFSIRGLAHGEIFSIDVNDFGLFFSLSPLGLLHRESIGYYR